MERARQYISERIAVEDRGYSTPCWIWQLARNEKGYGACKFRGERLRSHRLAYLGFVGPILDGLTIDHLCRVKSCCNPSHLEAVALQENIRRAAEFRPQPQRATHCKNGHELTPENVRVTKRGRACRKCIRHYKAIWRKNDRAQRGNGARLQSPLWLGEKPRGNRAPYANTTHTNSSIISARLLVGGED